MSFFDQNFTILMVNDDEDTCFLTEQAIQRMQKTVSLSHPNSSHTYQFQSVETGIDLFDYLNQNHHYQNGILYPRPHLILLDLNMPKMGGIEALSILFQNP